MSKDDPKRSDNWYIPPDIRLFLEPLVLLLFFGEIMMYLPLARRGDTSLFKAALILAGIGIVLLFIARWPLYRAGRFFSFGGRHLSGIHRRLYYLAYVFIVPSVVLLGLLLFYLR